MALQEARQDLRALLDDAGLNYKLMVFRVTPITHSYSATIEAHIHPKITLINKSDKNINGLAQALISEYMLLCESSRDLHSLGQKLQKDRINFI